MYISLQRIISEELSEYDGFIRSCVDLIDSSPYEGICQVSQATGTIAKAHVLEIGDDNPSIRSYVVTLKGSSGMGNTTSREDSSYGLE
jgi:hypothetical protein